MKLSKENRTKMVQMSKEIDALVSKAEGNIAGDKTKLEFAEKDLVGLTPELMKSLKPVPNKPGFKYVSLKKTEIGPVMKLV